THSLERLRQRYSTGLICTTCLALLATKPESYARSGLTETARLTYVCGECRADQAGVERLADIRRSNLAHARAALRASRNGPGPQDETPTVGTATASDVTPPSRGTENRELPRRGFVTLGRPQRTLEAASRRLRSLRRGGRPRRHETHA